MQCANWKEFISVMYVTQQLTGNRLHSSAPFLQNLLRAAIGTPDLDMNDDSLRPDRLHTNRQQKDAIIDGSVSTNVV